MIKELFSFRGRISKARHKKRINQIMLILSLYFFIHLIILYFAFNYLEKNSLFLIYHLPALLITIIAIWSSIATRTKRLHDVGKSGKIAMLEIMPVFGGFYWFFYLRNYLNQDGMQGPNEYGHDPLQDNDPLHISSQPIEPK